MNKKANKNKNNVNRDKYNTIKNAPGFLESTSLQGDDASETSGRNESEDGGDIEVVKIFREDQTYKYLPVDKVKGLFWFEMLLNNCKIHIFNFSEKAIYFMKKNINYLQQNLNC